ncbi:trypsin alpha-3 [Drosophila teissieri]|uniref:trypsin alpha-3 n=1 Tax=Drosophila teissieri TaxID=7243 RepID=UPI001CBA34B1|nr:trypsin alpha-3 [Drosophila teissieri]
MLFQWLLVVASVTLISAGSSPERIVGGHFVGITDVPWQAALLYSGSFKCGAVVYSEKIVITAAHCTHNAFDTLYSVRVGSVWKNLGGQLVRVAVIRRHEDYVYRFTAAFNDISVVRLADSLTFNSNVRPISLADAAPAAGTEATISGWGEFGIPGLGSAALLQASVKIVDSNACRRAYPYLTDAMICAAALLKDSCRGDSGGPLVSGGQLVGIVSYGKWCAIPYYPGVYANVAVLKPWILNATAHL